LRLLLLGGLLFIPAGGFYWLAGWIYTGLHAAWSVLNIILLGKKSPGLMRLREADRPAASEIWDKVFVSLGAGLTATLLLICAAEGPSSSWNPFVPAAAFLAIGAAYSLGLWALLSNSFAIGVAAIQEGQTPAEGGPYAVVRHPIYLASAVFFLATPAALGSYSGFIPGGLMAAAVAVRALLEDRLLMRSLPGYREYAVRTPYRLLPGIW
jgi:protein-S-isoprenylcysteine O-methyltransferase Ste14